VSRLWTWFYPYLLVGQDYGNTEMEVPELCVLVVVQLLREMQEISQIFGRIMPIISFKMYMAIGRYNRCRSLPTSWLVSECCATFYCGAATRELCRLWTWFNLTIEHCWVGLMLGCKLLNYTFL
jgi:hypothetical protein